MTPYYEHAGITIYHGDCREILPDLPKVDLVLTDPPYGINIDVTANKQSGRIVGHGHRRVAKRNYGASAWDSSPLDGATISALLLCSRFQIIWGGNYIAVPPSRCWLVWDKQNGETNYADCELAWTNLDTSVRLIQWLWNGFARAGNEPRYDHPTQKPLGVMKWCILQAPKDCSSILDPFIGTGTTLVAAKVLGRSAMGIEIEERYCEMAAKRLSQEVFTFEETALGPFPQQLG